MANLTRAADAAIDVALRCYARHVPQAKNAEAMLVIEDLLVDDLGASRERAATAVNRALLRKVARL